MSHVQIIQTKDGSQSLYLPTLNEHYHSIHGAKTESEHIYIQHGLWPKLKTQKNVRVLEIGMGTGLNVLCTYMASLQSASQIEYHTLEPFPLPPNIVNSLNYTQLWPQENINTVFQSIHECAFRSPISIHKNMMFTKYKTEIQSFEHDLLFDVIYFDAFAPEKQPDMWNKDVFERIFNLMAHNAILVTYCCKGEVKRILKSLGFKVEKQKGPVGGKREILRAIK